ncbi:MAG: protein translocase subunit SecD [Deltaproteobacteria bacterium]|nr:protein translocase subunit SecD [Deltaproteobacteria bacterium]
MSLRSRLIWISVIAVFGIYAAYPNLFSEQERLDNPWIPDAGLTLGLDLQGGVHWLLRVDTATVMRQELDVNRSQIEEDLDARNIAHGELRVVEASRIEIDGGDPAAIRALLEDRYTTLAVADREGGGLELTLTDDWNTYVLERGVRQSLEVLNNRIDQLGVREPIIAPQGEGRVLVQMAGDIDPETARSIISETTFLEFKLVLASAPNRELLEAQYAAGLPGDTEVAVSHGSDGAVTAAYLVPTTPALTGAMLEDARLGFDRRNRPIVQFRWNGEGTKIFRKFTGDNVGSNLAAIVDGEVITAPRINSRIGREGIIEGAFTQEEAAKLAVALRSGALPIPLVIEEERSVGPSLGADSIRQGLNSILIGGAAVVVFMVVYYSTSGLIANVALALNIILIVGLMSAFSATLTLPGIAGLVLTIGMAVDANVIIFERIREERRSGKTVRNAVQAGFNRSRLTILDANITTIIAAVVLLYFGRGPVQGFGVTLAIGIFSSVFCALIVTRALLELTLARGGERLRI